ncbi:MAG: hypothetical protein DRP09_17560 [Candidatus Thorarchaeota archaeon]|nr:MAG: hypothetical protein DRP09_17560 [Candidatus Thorarchaeota archaeon]
MGVKEFQIIVPWSVKKLEDGKYTDLGQAYNASMEYVADWVCFLDHDVMHLNPAWYYMCLYAINKLGHKAGWITGVTNAIACTSQHCPDAPANNAGLDKHLIYAKERFQKFGNRIDRMDPKTMGLQFSGFMILTHKKAWQDSGGFDSGFFGVDNYYFDKLTRSGYNHYVLPGMYLYHLYALKKLWFS